MKSILIFNNKGGTGKTTLANCLSMMLAQDYKVLMIDTDPQGNLSYSYGQVFINEEPPIKQYIDGLSDSKKTTKITDFISQTEYPNIDIIASGNMMKEGRTKVEQNLLKGKNVYMTMLANIRKECQYDYIIMDSSPFLGGDTTAILHAVDYALIPVFVDSYSTLGVMETLDYIDNVNDSRAVELDYGIVRNSYKPKSCAGSEKELELLDIGGEHVFKEVINTSEAAKNCQDKPMNPKSRTKFVEFVRNVTKELVERIGN